MLVKFEIIPIRMWQLHFEFFFVQYSSLSTALLLFKKTIEHFGGHWVARGKLQEFLRLQRLSLQLRFTLAARLFALWSLTMESETGHRRIKRLTQTRGGLRAIATKTMNKLDEFLYEELTSEVKYQISALHDVLTKTRTSLNSANSVIQGIINEDEIEDDMERSNDYDSKLALSIQKAMGKLAETNCHQREIPEEATGSPISTNSRLQDNGRLKLPKLDLPKFDGSYSQWASFSDLFNGALDSSTTLTDPQKFFYFNGLLTGEASRLIASVTVTDANYEVAKEMLKSRYDNRRANVRELLSKIIHSTPVTKPDPPAVRSLWQWVDEQRRALTALGIQLHEMDIYTIHLVVDKLDTESRRQWD